jgi:hypothetical protein
VQNFAHSVAMGSGTDEVGQIISPKLVKRSTLLRFAFIQPDLHDEKFWHAVCIKDGISRQSTKIPPDELCGKRKWD